MQGSHSSMTFLLENEIYPVTPAYATIVDSLKCMETARNDTVLLQGKTRNSWKYSIVYKTFRYQLMDEGVCFRL